MSRMYRAIACIMFAAVVEAQVAKLGNQRAAYASAAPRHRASPQLNYQGMSYNFPSMPAQQARFSSVATASAKDEAREWIENWKAKQGGLATTGEAAGAASGAGTTDLKVNVFGADTASCGSGPACSYSPEKPEVCISNVPYDQTKFWVAMPGKGAGKYVGNTDEAGEWKMGGQCMSVWELGAPSMIFGEKTMGSFLFPNIDWATWAQSFAKRVKYGFVDDVVVCEAVPAAVLDSAFSSEMYNNCEISYRIRPFGPGGGRVETADTNMKCQRFRNAIEKVCDLCGNSQAPNNAGSSSVASKCAALGVTPAAAASVDTESSASIVNYVLLFSLASFMLVVVGLSKVFRGFRKSSNGLQEPILEA